MEKNYLRNDKQIYYNQVRGVIFEVNEQDDYCNIALKVGHEVLRDVNLSMKRAVYDTFKGIISLGAKVNAKFFIVSRKKEGRWYTSANLLELEADSGKL